MPKEIPDFNQLPHSPETPEETQDIKNTKTEQQKRAELLERYIQTRVLDSHEGLNEEEEKRIEKIYSKKSPKEKADELYQKMIIFREASSGGEPEGVNKTLISRIKILFNDSKVRELLPETYGQARVDTKEFKNSELANTWTTLETAHQQKKKRIEEIKKGLFQENIKGKDNVEEAKTEMVELEEEVGEIEGVEDGIKKLKGYEQTPENTDTLALIHYQKIKEYREQLDKGFVWLPSREEIDRRAMEVIDSGNPKQTRKGVFFISEPGSGKSEQIRAIADRLTGIKRVKISCGPRMGDPQLLGKGAVFPGATEIEKGTFTDFRETVSSAWTGHDYSYQENPIRDSAQVVELDEMPKAFENETFFTAMKGLFSLKDGEKMPNTDKEVLPGRVIIGSGNIGQHHGAKVFPPALEREFEVIPVDYPEMSAQNPETYEFMLAALMENGAIQAHKDELKTGYKKIQIPEEERTTLSDGSVVVGRQELIEDSTSKEHGYLYRLAHAVKAVQNSYMARGGENAYIDYLNRDLLRYKDGADGSVSITETGSQIILGTTITLNDISGWMIGYKDEKRKKTTISLPEYIQQKLKDKVEAKHQDADKMQAIFDHFHLFDENQNSRDSESESTKPLTPKEIGYLSPRVPRPFDIEKPKPKIESNTEENADLNSSLKDSNQERNKEARKTDLITFEDEEVLAVSSESFDAGEAGIIPIGEKFIFQGQEFELVGVVADDKMPSEEGKAVGKTVDGFLFQRFDSLVLEKGIVEKFSSSVGGKIETYKTIIEKLCP